MVEAARPNHSAQITHERESSHGMTLVELRFNTEKQPRHLYAEVIQLALRMALLPVLQLFWDFAPRPQIFVTGVFPTPAWRIESGRDHVYHCVCLSGWCVMTTPACFSRRSRCLKACVSRGWGTGSNRTYQIQRRGFHFRRWGTWAKRQQARKGAFYRLHIWLQAFS